MFGNKYLLKIEERGKIPNQYTLLKEAEIRTPKHFADSTDIDRLCLVKVNEKLRPFERAFFLVENTEEFTRKSQELIESGKISQLSMQSAVIEEFVLGAQVNFIFFNSPLSKRLELFGTDTRRQTNLDGLLRLPGNLHKSVLSYTPITYEEVGHTAVTVLESLLEKAFEFGEAFVKASQKLFPPGIIGPFALQSIIVSGPPKKDIVVIDVSPRMPGSPGTFATPYSGYLFGKPISVGRRVAMEIRTAIKLNNLKKVVT